MDFQELAAKRYSARDFSQMPIPKAVIDEILMAGNPPIIISRRRSLWFTLQRGLLP